MYRDATVGVVVPAYNEEGFVGDVLRGLPDFVDSVYAVDDCSTDGTWAEILGAAEAPVRRDGGQTGALRHRDATGEDDRSFLEAPDAAPSTVRAFERRVDTVEVRDDLVAIAHTRNFGAGGAIKTGYLAGLVDGVDVVATIDGDGQMDPRIMDRIVDPVAEGRVEYAKGTRLVNGGHRGEMPLVRAFGNTALTYMTKAASGYWGMTDSQNGYTAISRAALRQLGVEDLFEYYAYCNAVLVRLNVHDFPIADVEVPTTYGDETSDIEISTFVTKVTPMLWRRFCWRLRTKHVDGGVSPVGLLYAAGALCLLAGSSLRLAADGDSDRRRPTALAGSGLLALLAAVGTESAASAGLVEVVPASDHEPAGGDP